MKPDFAVARGDAVHNSHLDRAGGAETRDLQGIAAIVVQLDAAKGGVNGACAGRQHEDAPDGVVGNRGVGHGQTAGSSRSKHDAVSSRPGSATETPDGAILEAQRSASIESDAIAAAKANPLYGQA